MSSTNLQRAFIPFGQPWVDERELREVAHCLESGWLTTGPKTARFEQELQNYIGGAAVVAVSSCTAALHIAYAASGLLAGDEVIMSPMTFCSTANVAVHLGAVPRFVDIEEDTENIACDQAEAAVNERTKLIVPVDFAGHPCDLDRIADIAVRRGLNVVEDAAHAIGAEYKGKRIGRHGWPACFSFYAIKNMTTGEGGAIACPDDPEFIERCRRLALHGMSKDAWQRYGDNGQWYYEVVEPGYKYNMTDLQAAIGIHQLRRLDEFIARRRHLAALYDQALGGVPQIRRPTMRTEVRHARHLYVIQLQDLPSRLHRDRVIEELKKRGIGTTVNFIPLHLHRYYRDRFQLRPEDLPVATRVYERSISLPLYPKMSDGDVEYVTEQLTDILSA
jgi:dTDP-4-amino-4,6-dideoxygalactose transaminase